jgi:hypothetical protein
MATASNPDSDDAMYMCRAENDVDSVDAEAKLTVSGNLLKLVRFAPFCTLNLLNLCSEFPSFDRAFFRFQNLVAESAKCLAFGSHIM